MGMIDVIAPNQERENRPFSPTGGPHTPDSGITGHAVSLPWKFQFHRVWPILVPVALALLTLGAFLPAVMSELVYWDDDDLLIHNIRYRVLSWDNLHWMFTTSYAGHFEPLTWLSFWLDWTLWKREFSGYHFTNVALHAGTALIFYFLARRLLHTATQQGLRPSDQVTVNSAPYCLSAGLAGMLFAVHPLRVESVAWLAERRDVLSGFFYLASVAAYVRWRTADMGPKTSRGWYWLALTFQGLSLLAKASAVSLPLVLLILDVYPLRRKADVSFGRRLGALAWDKAPFFVLAIAAGVRAWTAQVEAGAMYPLVEHDVFSRTAQAIYSLAFYPWKTLVPIDLSPLYQIPDRDVLMSQVLVPGLLGAALLVGLAILCRRRLPAVTAVIAVFIVTIAPVSGIFQSGPQLVADRYSYLSMLGFAILPATGLLTLAQTRWWRMRNVASFVALACAVVTVFLYKETVRQADRWSTALSLWRHAATICPESSIVHTNLADAIMALPMQSETVREAARHYQLALRIEPRDPIAAHHFADALAVMGNDQAAERLYQHSLSLDPSRSRVYLGLAELWIKNGRAHEAVALLYHRMQLAPYDFDAAAFLAELLATHPDPQVRDGCEAADLAERVSRARNHTDVGVLLTWASALAEHGDWEEALAIAQYGQGLAEQLRLERYSRELTYRIELFRNKRPYHYGETNGP